MAYNLLVSAAQLERIALACEKLDQSQPLTAEQLKDPNLEFLTSTLDTTLSHPADDKMLHGICL